MALSQGAGHLSLKRRGQRLGERFVAAANGSATEPGAGHFRDRRFLHRAGVLRLGTGARDGFGRALDREAVFAEVAGNSASGGSDNRRYVNPAEGSAGSRARAGEAASIRYRAASGRRRASARSKGLAMPSIMITGAAAVRISRVLIPGCREESAQHRGASVRPCSVGSSCAAAWWIVALAYRIDRGTGEQSRP